MKSKLFMAIAALFALVSCKQDPAGNLGEISLSSETLTFSANQLTAQQVSVSFDGSWYFKSEASWVTVQRNGSDISVRVEKNSVRESRTATITVLSVVENGPSKDITVVQEAMVPEYDEDPVLSISPTEIVFPAVNPTPVEVRVTTAGGVKWANILETDIQRNFFTMTVSEEDENVVIFTPTIMDNTSSMANIAVFNFFNTNSKVQVPSVKLTIRQPNN